jgi:signal peptidase II
MKQRIRHLIYFIILIAFDQVSKLWIKTNLIDGKEIMILPGILKLSYHQNSGAVWGIMGGKVSFLRIFTMIILALIIYLYFKIPKDKKYNALKVITVFIMAGAVGNLIDRIYLGYVVDFIYFYIIDFPLFNFADSYLTVSSALLLILAIFYYKDSDFAFLDQLFRKKKKDTGNNNDTEQ